jgi:hypothetical protein
VHRRSITLKEVAYFSSVYFAEAHNINAPTMQYNMDEEPPYSDLSIFASRSTIVGSSESASRTSCRFWCLNDRTIKELISFAKCETEKMA